MEDKAAALRNLPGVDEMLRLLPDAVAKYGHDQVVAVARAKLDGLRTSMLAGERCKSPESILVLAISNSLKQAAQTSLRPVLNLTGTVLHTNLGRATLSQQAIDAMVTVAQEPSNLEFDLDTGQRGERDHHVENLICELTGAEAATCVNNNAAAVLLVLNSLASGREVPVSRGELVEIGGSFRIPEVMERSGARLIEVGATNRTHLRDYDKAIGADTALLMKVHTSNYRVEGFTAAVSERELADLAHAKSIPLVVDLGSGCLTNMEALGLPAEPTVAEVLSSGVDLVTFSGDKLLGGPQCGIVAGRADLISALRSNPLKRALRSDKLTLAALVATLQLYRDPQRLAQALPTLHMLTRSREDIQHQAEALQPPLQRALGDTYRVLVEQCHSQIGSGALPVETLASCALTITATSGIDSDIRRLQVALRELPRPVIGRLNDGKLSLDLRCLTSSELFEQQLAVLAEILA